MSSLNNPELRKNRVSKQSTLPFMAALSLLTMFPSHALALPAQEPPSPKITARSLKSQNPGLLLAQIPGTMPMASPAPTAIPKIGQTNLTTLRQAVKSGKVTMQVQGDGVTTSSVRLLLTNTTNSPLKVVLPANEILLPNVASVQKMMVTKDQIISLPVGQVAIAEVPTICASVKTIPPPPKGGVVFDIGNYPDAKVWKQLSAIIAASNDLEKNGGYGNVPIAKDRKEQIAQLAVWRLLGLISGRPEHAVTPETIGADLMRELSQQVKKDPGLMTKLGGGYKLNNKGELEVEAKQKKVIDDRVASIFDAIDLTISRAEDPKLKKVASLPQDSTWDTFTNVGERAFADGDLVESTELLSQAVTEAEAFGEADPRLSRSLTSLGRAYIDYSWYEKAESLLNRALNLREKVSGKDSPDVAEVDIYLGLSKQQQNLLDAAEPLFQKALAILEKAAGASSRLVADALNDLGKNFDLKGDGASAEPLLKRALAIMMLEQQSSQPKGTMSKGSPEVAEVETNLAISYKASGKYPEAKALFEKALAMDVKLLGDDHAYVATILDGLADVCNKMGQKDQGELFKKQAQTIRETKLGKDHELLASLPLGFEALTRISAYELGAKEISSSRDTVNAKARTIPGASVDKAQVNRPIKDKWALVIGVSKFQDPSINLQYAAKDAQDFAHYLTTEGKFAPDHVRLLVNEKATRENIMDQIGDKWLPRVANPDDLVLIFVSSHGSPSQVDLNGINYLVAYNTDKNRLYATGVPMQDFVSMIKKRVHSDRVVMMMDACHSGATQTGGKGIFRLGGYNAEELAQGSGQLVICSSDPKQVSWESNRYKNGVFTHYLLEGLRKNGQLTKLGDAFSYMQDKVQEEVLKDRGELQTPLLKSKWEGDDLVIGVTPTQAREGIPDEQTQTVSAPPVASKGLTVLKKSPAAKTTTTVKPSASIKTLPPKAVPKR